jgi:cyclophilin family peptidyl-prolyl cis-trans isomerase
MRALFFSVAIVLALVAGGCGGGDEESAGTGGGECAEVEQPDPRTDDEGTAPTEPLDAETTYTLVFETSCGTFRVELDPEQAPKTSASLVALAEDGFFDDTTFHRVVPDFVIQGGDPTARGDGGPGYTTVDPPRAGSRYVRGVVAMAKTPTEPAGAGGSQFFVVTGEDVGLPAEYAIVGEVTEGFDAIDRIEALGVQDGPPSRPVVVETVTVEES